MPMDWFDGEVTLTFEIALSADTAEYGLWDVGVWDTATWGPDIVWSDLSTRLRQGITTSREFSREVSTWESGTASFVLANDDAALSPDNLTGPYASGGITQIRPGRPVRLSATYNGVTYPLYRGYDNDWQDGWEPGADIATVTVPCVDEMDNLGAFDGLEQSAQGAGETSGRRVHRVLDNAGHGGARRVDEGRNTLQATTLSSNAVTELKLVADSEDGSLYVDTDGTVVFEHRYALVENTRSNTVQATLGDGSGGLDEIPCTDQGTAYNRDLVSNIAAFARAGGTTQTAADATSRALYKDRRKTRTDLVCETDAQVLELAQWHVARLKDPERRFTFVTIKPRTDPVRMWPVALGLRVRDLVRVIRRAPGAVTLDRRCHIAGISHTVTKDDWETTFKLSSASVYVDYYSARWDVGLWDTARWNF